MDSTTENERATGFALTDWLTIATAIETLSADPADGDIPGGMERTLDMSPALVSILRRGRYAVAFSTGDDTVVLDAEGLVSDIENTTTPSDPDDMVGWALVLRAMWSDLTEDQAASAFDYIEAAYWFCTHWYAGQGCPRYAALCFLGKDATYRNEPDGVAQTYSMFESAERAK